MAIVEILQQNALLSIAAISAALALGSTLVYKFATDQALMREIRAEVKKIQKEMKQNRGNPEKLTELQKKITPLNLKLMSQSMKPMLITIVPFIIIFAFLRSVYNNTVVLPLPFWEGHLGWIGTYIIFSIIFTSLFRRALKVA